MLRQAHIEVVSGVAAGPDRRSKLVLLSVVWAWAGIALVSPMAFAQSSVASSVGGPSAGSPRKLAFDAASVRVSSQKIFSFSGFDLFDPVSSAPPPPGGLFSWNAPLAQFIAFAYDLRQMPMKAQLNSALPKWTHGEWYAIEARAEGNPTRDDVREMVRSLLEERFQFAAHIEKRQAEVYALQVMKPGLGLKAHLEGAPCTLPASMMDANKYPHADPPYKEQPVHCGIFYRLLSPQRDRRLEMLDVTMQQIVDSLGNQRALSETPLTVVDHTGLEGRYDAVLDFGLPAAPENPDTSDEIGLPPLWDALQKQLGLKLVKQTAQVDYFVIDHIGPLTEN